MKHLGVKIKSGMRILLRVGKNKYSIGTIVEAKEGKLYVITEGNNKYKVSPTSPKCRLIL